METRRRGTSFRGEMREFLRNAPRVILFGLLSANVPALVWLVVMGVTGIEVMANAVANWVLFSLIFFPVMFAMIAEELRD